MTTIALIAANLIAIALLTFGLYFRRHHRRDLVVAFLGVNVGVMAVALVLGAMTSTSLGLGLGLFGVLSIIRLRSTQIDQRGVFARPACLVCRPATVEARSAGGRPIALTRI